jgi:DNA-binding CsgD family transcriptional regulator
LDTKSRRLLQTFEKIRAAPDTVAAIRAFQAAYEIDFVTYHLSQTTAHVVDAPFVRTTYHDAWVSRYLLRGYVLVDPVVQQGFSRLLPFDWREIDPPPGASEFLADALRHGLGPSGFSIPILDKSRRALLSLNSFEPDYEWSRIVSTDRAEWVELAHLIHKRAVSEVLGHSEPMPELSPRELQCLHWTALGNDAKGISLILGLSEHTISSYLKSARFKLGCLTKAAATARAIQLRLINPYSNTLK